jgi:hypothetical protein
MRLTRRPAADSPVPFGRPGAEVFRDTDGRLSAIGYPTRTGHALFVPRIGTFQFRVDGEEVAYQPLPTAPEELVDDAYHRMVLPLVRQFQGEAVLHASAVRLGGGIVALCGRAGAGKSTLAFALGTHGHVPCADDAVAFDVSEDPIRVLPVPFRLRLRPESAEWFGAPSLVKGSEMTTPWQAADPAPFLALFVLDRLAEPVAEDCVVERLTPGDAFLTVLPHAYYVALDDAASNRTLVTSYLELVARVPVLALRYYPALDAVDRIAATVLSEVQAL